MHRFFVEPDAIENGVVRFSREQAHQIGSVLRLSSGASVLVLDNSGWQFGVTLDRITSAGALGQITSRSLVSSEPRTKITLYAALIRPNRFELVLQKCTELGVAAFVPILSQRCIVGQVDEASSTKMDRWQRIISEAAEQSGRGKLPALLPALPFDQACEQVRGLSLLFWEREKESGLRGALSDVSPNAGTKNSGPPSRPFSVNVFIGPEGGFTEAEVARARGIGIKTVSIGSRILRAETASIAAVTAILFAQGDLG